MHDPLLSFRKRVVVRAPFGPVVNLSHVSSYAALKRFALGSAFSTLFFRHFSFRRSRYLIGIGRRRRPNAHPRTKEVASASTIIVHGLRLYDPDNDPAVVLVSATNRDRIEPVDDIVQ